MIDKVLLYCKKSDHHFLNKSVDDEGTSQGWYVFGKRELRKNLKLYDANIVVDEALKCAVNGLICASCDIDNVEFWNTEWYPKKENVYMDLSRPSFDEDIGEYDFSNCRELYTNEDIETIDDSAPILKKSCLTFDELGLYASGQDKSGGGDFYALYLTNVKAIKPFEITKLAKEKPSIDPIENMLNTIPSNLKRAPQNMCYAYWWNGTNYERVLVISIRPKYLCKILNGEKTIEIRRVIPNELKELIE